MTVKQTTSQLTNALKDPNHVFIIAEAGVNHNGILDNALELVDLAVEANVDCVKFQMFRAEKLASKSAEVANYQNANTNNAYKSQKEMLKALELTDDDFRTLKAYCDEKNIIFLVTPFDEDSLDFLMDELGLTMIKVGSGDMNNAPLLLKAARKGADIIISSGMANEDEIRTAMDVMAYGYCVANDTPQNAQQMHGYSQKHEGQDALRQKVAFLHCTTQYPTPLDSVNLRAMDTLGKIFPGSVGFSDHTQGIVISTASVAAGARIVEKHFTISRDMEGPDHKASLEPDELAQMTKDIRDISAAMGISDKKPSYAEAENVNIARKSLVAKTGIPKGTLISAENLTVKRPGHGIDPIEYWSVLGKIAQHDIEEDSVLKEEDYA